MKRIGGSFVPMRVRVASIAYALSVFVLCSATNAQEDVKQLATSVVTGVIHQLQTGTVDERAYHPDVLRAIASQTGNTGRYSQLAQLGPVTDISIANWMRFSDGEAFSVLVQHQAGFSSWAIGFRASVPRIEYLFFNAATDGQPLAPDPYPKGNPLGQQIEVSTVPQTEPERPPVSPSTERACREYGNLMPDVCALFSRLHGG